MRTLKVAMLKAILQAGRTGTNRRCTPPPGPSGMRSNGFISNSQCSGVHCTQQQQQQDSGGRERGLLPTNLTASLSQSQIQAQKYHVSLFF